LQTNFYNIGAATWNRFLPSQAQVVIIGGIIGCSTAYHLAKLGKPSMYSNARKKVEEILAQPIQAPLPGDISNKLEDILMKADRGLG
jgi:phosphate/sulfate permease